MSMSIEIHGRFTSAGLTKRESRILTDLAKLFLAKDYDEAKGKTEARRTKPNQDVKNFLI